MILTSSNYHGLEANKEFWSVSLFKAFDRCEASGLASVRGQYEREQTDALLIGSYVDAYFSGDGGTTRLFSRCSRILELRRGIQDASFVGPGKTNLPFELRGKAGDCSRVAAGPIDLI